MNFPYKELMITFQVTNTSMESKIIVSKSWDYSQLKDKIYKDYMKAAGIF